LLTQKDIFLSGVVVTLGSGVATVQGFMHAFVGEVFEIGLAKGTISYSYGIVVNLLRDETMNLLIGALMLNPENRITEGAKVRGISKLLTIVVGDFSIGSMLDATGNLLLSSTVYTDLLRWVVESPAPGIVDRQSVFEPLQTGVIAIDALIPIGLGQREGLLGDRRSGKTETLLTIMNTQRLVDSQVRPIYIMLGQKSSSIASSISSLL
jgi:F-type H+-transporting ATPase subunit alpha